MSTERANLGACTAAPRMHRSPRAAINYMPRDPARRAEPSCELTGLSTSVRGSASAQCSRSPRSSLAAETGSAPPATDGRPVGQGSPSTGPVVPSDEVALSRRPLQEVGALPTSTATTGQMSAGRGIHQWSQPAARNPAGLPLPRSGIRSRRIRPPSSQLVQRRPIAVS